jgi:hypothetical protein
VLSVECLDVSRSWADDKSIRRSDFHKALAVGFSADADSALKAIHDSCEHAALGRHCLLEAPRLQIAQLPVEPRRGRVEP